MIISILSFTLKIVDEIILNLAFLFHFLRLMDLLKKTGRNKK